MTTWQRWALPVAVTVTLMLVLAAILWWSGLLTLSLRVVVTQADLDSELTKRFPIERKHLGLFTVTYDHPRATIQADGRISVGLDATFSQLKSLPLRGSADATAKILYDPATGSFHLHETTVDRLDFPGIPTSIEEKAAAFATPFLGSALNRWPIHQLKRDDAKRWILRQITVEDRALVLHLGL